MAQTADQILPHVRKRFPDSRLAINRNRTAIGVYLDERSRFVPVASDTLMNEWFWVNNDPHVNGEPMVADGDWVEVPGLDVYA